MRRALISPMAAVQVEFGKFVDFLYFNGWASKYVPTFYTNSETMQQSTHISNENAKINENLSFLHRIYGMHSTHAWNENDLLFRLIYINNFFSHLNDTLILLIIYSLGSVTE